MERSREKKDPGHKDRHTFPSTAHDGSIQTFFVSRMNYVNDHSILSCPQHDDARKMEEEKTEMREMPPPYFFSFFFLQGNLSHLRSGSGFQLYSHVKRGDGGR